MNRCLELLDLPNEVLERIGHFLYERPDVHIESSSGSTPTLRYKQCSKQVEELLRKKCHDNITSFMLTCQRISGVIKEGVLSRPRRGCIFDQATFLTFNTSVEGNDENVESFSHVRLELRSFDISFLQKLPSTYLWRDNRLEVFLLQPDDPIKAEDLQECISEFFPETQKIHVDCSVKSLVSNPQSMLGLRNNVSAVEVALPTTWLHSKCRDFMLFQTSDGGVVWKAPGFDLKKRRKQQSLLRRHHLGG
ncbi:hypothetical protein FPOAC2_13719 [Fusarium poae]